MRRSACRKLLIFPVRSGTARPPGNPRVSIIVPACNEEADIEATLTRLLALDYDNYEVIAVDDRSTDRTGEIMERVAAGAPPGRLQVIRISDLPAGWMGKPHAMWSAGNQATGDWLLFTDADVLFKPDVLRRAVAYAEAEPADHLVLFPRMIMKRPGEKMMIAFFQTLFVFGHRPWKVADPKTRDHIGVGAFNMVRRKVYEASRNLSGPALRGAGRHETGQDREKRRPCPTQCVWRGPDFHPLGEGRDGCGGQPHQEFLCHHVIPVATGVAILLRFAVSEPDAFRRDSPGSWMGQAAIRSRPVFDVLHLRGNVDASRIFRPTTLCCIR